MSTPNQQLTPPTHLIEAGRAWAEDAAWANAAQQARCILPEMYVDGAMLWQAHRSKLQRVIEAGEGVEGFSHANPHSEDPDLRRVENAIVLNDGSRIRASKVLWLPTNELDVPSLDGQTGALPNGGQYKQGRGHIALSVDAGVPRGTTGFMNLDGADAWLKLEEAVKDEHIPKEITVTETVATTVDAGDGNIQRATISMHYALERDHLWNLPQSRPDIHEQPDAFREWVSDRLGLSDYSPKIDLSIFATGSGTIDALQRQVDKINAENASDETFVANLKRCGQLIGAYAAQQFPELVPHLASAK